MAREDEPFCGTKNGLYLGWSFGSRGLKHVKEKSVNLHLVKKCWLKWCLKSLECAEAGLRAPTSSRALGRCEETLGLLLLALG